MAHPAHRTAGTTRAIASTLASTVHPLTCLPIPPRCTLSFYIQPLGPQPDSPPLHALRSGSSSYWKTLAGGALARRCGPAGARARPAARRGLTERPLGEPARGIGVRLRPTQGSGHCLRGRSRLPRRAPARLPGMVAVPRVFFAVTPMFSDYRMFPVPIIATGRTSMIYWPRRVQRKRRLSPGCRCMRWRTGFATSHLRERRSRRVSIRGAAALSRGMGRGCRS